MSLPQPTHLILDLGHVFIFYHPHPSAPIPPATFKSILESPIWFSYERGELTQPECYNTITSSPQWNLLSGAIDKTVQMCVSTFCYNETLVSYVKALKKRSNDSLKVHAMSNISLDEWAVARNTVLGWDMFDSVWISAEVGTRKPERMFYERVLEGIGAGASQALFVDDRKDNVEAARALDIDTVHFVNEKQGLAALRRVFGDSHEEVIAVAASFDEKMPAVVTNLTVGPQVTGM